MQTQLIFVAAHLGIADHLANGPKAVAELARATGTVESRLYRVLRALSSVGLFREGAPRCFETTPLADLLRHDHPCSMRDLALMLGSPWHVRSWASLLDAVATERSAFEGAFGCSLFEYLDRHSDDSERFDDAMSLSSKRHAAAICEAYDFSRARSVVDVAGGCGTLLAEILRRNPGVRGALFERPAVAVRARSFVRSHGLDARCVVVEGDLTREAPPAGDVLILKNVLHDWDDQAAASILRNCRRSLSKDGRLLVVDTVMPEMTTDFMTVCADLEMMVLLTGRERTLGEFERLFSRVGLRLSASIQTRANLHVLEAVAC